ncbi:Pleckstrin [Nibea albiflora]|uniref:Pleckstrin n=1 Tax=Nibea albiflora TaxID=240163 RepID=A0ACB7EDP8_NIBAL|nr:Pleckstrin [Nibea albiflora]
MIPLKGATLISPCQDFGKRTLVFKITSEKKQDHFFQASHVEEREFWVKDIKRAITELYTLMRDQDDGVRELKLEQENRVFNHCFTGATVVEWLISKGKARNSSEAVMLATGLLSEGFLQPAGDMSKEGAESGNQGAFLDHTNALYYFADSGFFCEGYSSDEDVLLKEEFRGNIVKQGCLLKQGHKRKNWKVRKFILRDDPAYMHYFDPSKADDPLGSIHLRGSVITAVEFVPDAKKYEVEGNLFEIITSDDTHYFLQAATADERKEWIKAIQAVSKTGK